LSVNWTTDSDPIPADADAFGTMAQRAYDALPEEFRALTGNVVIEIADWPSPEVLNAMEVDSPYELLGLFQGIGRTLEGASPWTGQMPNMIWLYRRPIIAYWQDHDERLEDVVTHVLIHELGHHFGLSDEDMERIENGEVL